MTSGVAYVVFGAPAAACARRSVHSLRKVAPRLPVTVVGDRPISQTNFLRWTGSPVFVRSGSPRYRFRAGVVVPELYRLIPYEWVLYVDADTEFIRNPAPGFDLLHDHDVAIATHHSRISVEQIRTHAHNPGVSAEVDATLTLVGDVPCVNAGIIFWRRKPEVKALFDRWGEEWRRFGGWDNQMAFMRAAALTPEVRVLELPFGWNGRTRDRAEFIYHYYGRGRAASGGRS